MANVATISTTALTQAGIGSSGPTPATVTLTINGGAYFTETNQAISNSLVRINTGSLPNGTQALVLINQQTGSLIQVFASSSVGSVVATSLGYGQTTVLYPTSSQAYFAQGGSIFAGPTTGTLGIIAIEN